MATLLQHIDSQNYPVPGVSAWCRCRLSHHRPKALRASVATANVSSRFGFSLFEVLMVIALFAVIVGLITLNFEKLIPAAQERPVDSIIVEAISDARLQAVKSGEPVLLGYDHELEAFTLIAVANRSTQPPLVESDDESSEAERVFASYPFPKGQVDDVAIYRRMDQPAGFSRSSADYVSDPMPYIRFHPSGVSTPVRLLIRHASGAESEYIVDPFSSELKDEAAQ